MSLERDLEHLPISTLANLAREAGHDSSIVQTREQLIAAILDDAPLPPNPIRTVRLRVHGLIDHHWDAIHTLMDRGCMDCFKSGQQRCFEVRAMVDYLANLPSIGDLLDE